MLMATVALCVAVVDDEGPVRTALGRLLRLSGYDILSFPCGEAFLAALDVRRPDCVILDVHMPGLSGLDVQSRLRAAHIDIPVIFITASDEPDLVRQTLEAGGTRLLRKPFSNDELLAAIGAALGGKPRDAA
jgi:FixJ family two-component response regulator